jgi:hypothetical protein
MKRFIDVCRLVLVSAEAFCILLLLAGLDWWPQAYTRMGELLQSNGEALKYLITVPVALLGACIKFSWDILFPSGDNTVLLEWDGYQGLMDRIYFSVALCVLCCAAAFAVWIFKTAIPLPWLTVAGLFSWCVPITTTATSYRAAHKVRYLLERYR